jgi:hypothetical protein
MKERHFQNHRQDRPRSHKPCDTANVGLQHFLTPDQKASDRDQQAGDKQQSLWIAAIPKQETADPKRRGRELPQGDERNRSSERDQAAAQGTIAFRELRREETEGQYRQQTSNGSNLADIAPDEIPVASQRE